MGWYQWQLFVVVGFGWASDNLWPIVTSLILGPVTQEFGVSRPPLLSLAQNIGLLAGAVSVLGDLERSALVPMLHCTDHPVSLFELTVSRCSGVSTQTSQDEDGLST